MIWKLRPRRACLLMPSCEWTDGLPSRRPTLCTRSRCRHCRDGRFQDFQRSLPGISPNTLSSRLKRLEEAGIVERRFYEQHPPRAEYLLTQKGEELRPILRTLFDWGQRHTRYRGSDK